MRFVSARLCTAGARAALFSMALTLAAGIQGNRVWAQSIPIPPDSDSFYHQPEDQVAAAQPGEILDSRQVTLEDILSAPGVAWDLDAWQIAYRSNDTHGQPITAVATLIKPRGTAVSPRKLYSVSMPENSTAGYCAPSYAMRYGAAIPSLLAGQVFVPLQTRFILAAVQRGLAVIVPDDEGPNSAYSAGLLAAHITLDGIRAATHFTPLETEPGTPVALVGYSGGSTGVSRAAEMAESYAPDLNIVGIAEGGVLVDLEGALDQESGTGATGLALASVMGVASEYPELADYLEQNASPDFRVLMKVKRPMCAAWQGLTLPFLNLKRGLNYQNSAVAQQVFDQENLGKSVPHIPLFIWQSRQDEYFDISYTDQLVNYYCQDPQAQVQYFRDGVPEHILAGLDGGSAAALWLFDRLNGQPASAGCSIKDVSSLAGQ